MIKGWKEGLTERDLFSVYTDYQCQRLGDKLEEVWSKESENGTRSSLLKAIMSTCQFECWLYGIILFPIDLILAFVASNRKYVNC